MRWGDVNRSELGVLANQPRSSWPSARQASGSGSLARSQEILAGPQYARRVREEEFTYPPYGLPLVEAYDSRFEAVFVLLHPFIQMPERLSWTANPPVSDGCRRPHTRIALPVERSLPRDGSRIVCANKPGTTYFDGFIER
jgi:hypothetical protein